MSFYITAVGEKSAWHGDKRKIVNSRVNSGKIIATGDARDTFYIAGAKIQNNPDICYITDVQLQWEDY